jgi:hypothetical protein
MLFHRHEAILGDKAVRLWSISCDAGQEDLLMVIAINIHRFNRIDREICAGKRQEKFQLPLFRKSDRG